LRVNGFFQDLNTNGGLAPLLSAALGQVEEKERPKRYVRAASDRHPMTTDVLLLVFDANDPFKKKTPSVCTAKRNDSDGRHMVKVNRACVESAELTSTFPIVYFC
jgi:hypothetical protein